ncbi:MAG: hypothetical protein ACREMN_05960 [Gemmatimonadales bacterium]
MSLTPQQRAQALDELARRAAAPPRSRGRAPSGGPGRVRPAKPVTRATLDALRRVERELARATPDTAATTILAVVRELRGADALSVEVGRAGAVERLASLGVPDAESAVDTAFGRYGLIGREARP